MIDFLMNNLNVLLITGDCSILGAEFNSILKEIFMWVQIAVPILVVVLCMVDMAQAVISQDEKGMKTAQGKAIKRVIIGIAIFFVPVLLEIVLDLAGIATGVCGIGG